LIEGIENDFIEGRDRFPTSVSDAYHRLTNYTYDPRLGQREVDGGEIAFVNADGERKQGKVRNKDHVTCHRCRKKGHYANECENERATDGAPESRVEMKLASKKQTGTTLVTEGAYDVGFLDDQDEFDEYQFINMDIDIMLDARDGVVMQIEGHGKLPRNWILLDNQSTVDVFCNRNLLTNIREHSSSMEIHCNAGVTSTKMIGMLQGYGTVWYNPTGIANILSLAKAKERGYRVTFDSAEGNAFHLHKDDGTVRVFQQSPKGLYYLDTKTGHDHDEMSLINTVEDNGTKYSQRDYSKAELARKIQKIIGRPSTKTFLSIVDKNLLANCPVTRADIIAAEAIFGPDVGSLKGKTVRKASSPVQADYTSVPKAILSRYQEVCVAGDIMFVNKLPFFVTISRHIKFSTSEFLANQKTETILKAIKHVHQTYSKRGFRITHFLMDGQFDKDGLDGDLAGLGITLNSVAADEHVPEIERHIRTIKERARSIVNMLPFDRFPARITIELVYYCVFWLNNFPPKGGISDTMSPRAIVVGSTIDYAHHCQIEFGTYVQTHEVHDNTMLPRTTGAIALRPTGNAQGGHYFYSLTTGRRLNRNHWTVLPMPADVVTRIHRLSRRPLALTAIEFANRAGVPLDDDDDDDAAHADGEDDDNDEDDNDYDPAVDDANIAGVHDDDDETLDDEDDGADDDALVALDDANNAELAMDLELALATEPEPDVDDTADEIDIGGNDAVDDAVGADEDNAIEEIGDNDEVDAAIGADDNDADNIVVEDDDITARMDATYGPRTSAYDLRARKPRDYGHIHTTLESTMFTQHNVRKGMKLFGEAGVDAVKKELTQLHERGVLAPKDLNDHERKAALQYLMFLKQKRDGTIKGRGCADGRKQRAHTTKEEASSPTVAIESVMLSCVIDAKENRDVGTVDLPGAFMQADMEGTVHMKLEGKMAELLVRIDPKLYRKYIRIEKGRQVLYVQLMKALYGTLTAAFLFWKRLCSQLIKWGFELNPYDTCVANKMINGKQCTILWHVDDLKISHVEPSVVTSVIELLQSEFGKEAPLTITRGKVHEYLGMTIDYSIPGKVKFTMLDYIKGMLDDLPSDMDGAVITPASSHLFDVDESAEMLSEELGNTFHHNTAKLLFLCKRARPDIQTAVAFLCTRVKAPDVDDYKKLARTMKYLRGSLYMPLILEADDLNVVKWWADASFAVHPDMKSHTGGLMTLGKGAIYGTSTRQKINTKSSTEAELVGLNDVMPQVLWTRYFLEAQGYGVNESIVYQDNKSTILLAENGKASSGRRTRHINIRYFFVKDRIASGELKIEYCPTQEMMADFFTKPLQGTSFTRMRDMIMNANPQCLDYAHEDCRSVLNMNHGDSDEITTPGTDDGWITVKSKKKKDKTERTMSRVNAGKNESILYTNGMRVNGQRNDNRVSFAADSL
jgi:hypothetical protein